MSVKVNGCYYHEGKAAVAVCAQCGVGICRQCAVKDNKGRVICVSCGNKNLKEEHKKYRQMQKQQGARFKDKKEFMKPGIIGLLIVFVTFAYVFYEGVIFQEIGRCRNIIEVFFFIIAMILFAYMLFSIPFAIILMEDIIPPKYATIMDIIGKWLLRVFVSLFLGWIVFTFYWVRCVILNKKKTKE